MAKAHNDAMDRLDHLEKRVDIIDDRLSRIEGDVATLKSDVATLKSNVATLQLDVATIKETLSEVKISLARISAMLDISDIRSFVERAHTDIYKWTVTIIAVVGAIYFGMQKATPVLQSSLSTALSAPQQSAAAPAPPAPAPRQ
ncbi:hypothetical protein [Bordetella sp. N]|uniref:hypothetical protein n=1 Tax=Bordetella sp. N TaxID=1746199 RepID=UPI00070A9710|nr:hypothetical protein [Bordetella sp. N]ALM83655.1 hypothetical protein ASB57_12345 [Bordetella sp. N]